MRRISLQSILPAMIVGGIIAAALPAWSKPSQWELDLAYHDPQRISVRLPGDALPTTFWYVLFTVTNETGRDVDFYPTVHVVTDQLGVIEAGYDVSPSVFDAIEERHKKMQPFMVRPEMVYGHLLQGEDNALTTAFVFPDLDPAVNRFTVYFGGLSDRIERVRNLGYDAARGETDANPKNFTLRKTLSVTYDIPGDAQTRQTVKPVRVKQEWVMR